MLLAFYNDNTNDSFECVLIEIPTKQSNYRLYIYIHTEILGVWP